MEEKVHDEATLISRMKEGTSNKQNPQSFIMNSYVTLSSVVGDEADKDSKASAKTTPCASTHTKVDQASVYNLAKPNQPLKGKHGTLAFKDDAQLTHNDVNNGKLSDSFSGSELTVKERCALAGTAIERIGDNKSMLHQMPFDAKYPFNIFQKKVSSIKIPDYRPITFKLLPKDMAKVTDKLPYLSNAKILIRSYLDNSNVRLTRGSREALALVDEKF